MFVLFARHLTRFRGNKAGSHDVGKLLCYCSVRLLVLICRHLLTIFTWLDWTLSQPSPLSLFVFWMVLLCATISFSISFLFLHGCHWVCILSCGYVGLFVRRWCCGFLVCCHCKKTGYRILNCIIISWSFIFGFLSFDWDSSNSCKSHFCCSYCFACSFLFEIHLCRLLFFLSVIVCGVV